MPTIRVLDYTERGAGYTKSVDNQKEVIYGDEIINQTMSLNSVNLLFSTCIMKCGYEFKYIPG